MFRRVEIKLALPVVLPLVKMLRKQANDLEATAPSDLPTKPWRSQANMLEVHALLDLFHPKFPRTGTISIDESRFPLLIRACSFLRLQIRYDKLASIPDTVMEAEQVAADPANDDALSYYQFLATLQETMIKSFPIPAFRRSINWQTLKKLHSPLRFLFGGRKNSVGTEIISPVSRIDSNVDSWQVVVLNDPVNLMSYVTAVFRTVFRLPEEVATQRMLEVHELKSSFVWRGARNRGEKYVRELRSWHLNAIVRESCS